MYIPPSLVLTPLARIERERVLPYSGRVQVSTGDTVTADTIVARAPGRARLFTVDVARQLGVSADEASKALVVNRGDDVRRGQVIARQNTMLGAATVRSPHDGTVAEVLGSQVLLSAAVRPIELRAQLNAVVQATRSDLGVKLETTGAIVQGMWGNGGRAFGPLVFLTPDDAVPESLEPEMAGAIAVVPGTVTRDGLRAAQRVKLAGLVVGFARGHMVQALQKAKLAVMLTEGFGEHPMHESTWMLLTDNAGREASLDASPPDRLLGRQPELLIPVQSGLELPAPRRSQRLARGVRVRVIRGQHAGKSGTVAEVPVPPQRLTSGVTAPVAVVNLDDGDKAMLAQVNLVATISGVTGTSDEEDHV